MTDNIKVTVGLIVSTAKAETLKKAVFSKPIDRAILRTTATVRRVGGKTVIQTETLHADNKATHANIPTDDDGEKQLAALAEGFAQINLITGAGDCEYRRSKSGKDAVIGGERLKNALKGSFDTVEPVGNDRKKQYILNGGEPFLIKLGVSDKNGRPHDKKLPKLRQINRFLEYVRDIEKQLPAEGTLHICDLCCGKSYLSFAVYHYFANIKNRRVEMYGVDLKPDVMEFCAAAAGELGFDGLRFVCADVGKFEPKTPPSLVISLHACDTATDLVLNKAAGWHTRVILSTPCCHHELNRTIDCAALGFITEHSMLRQKLCDAATDALRLKKLEAEGYTVGAAELVDPDDTPKNILLRAVYNGRPDEKARLEYCAALEFLTGKVV